MKKPQQASASQRRASNPVESVWVSANAGSGKTHVLVDRVIRLMLDGTEPSRILCLTFTKAAASEMINRIFGKLAAWATFSDQDLQEHLAAIGHHIKGHKDLDRARCLFTLALESPGGLKIQTIHAFCERLLQLFPVEGGVVPGFKVMDDVLTSEILEEARQELLVEATERGPYREALMGITSRLQADSFDLFIKALLAKRLEIGTVISSRGAIANAIAELRQLAGIHPEESSETAKLELTNIDEAAYRETIAVLSTSTKRTDEVSAGKLGALLSEQQPELRADLLKSFFLTKDHKPKSSSSLITKALGDADFDTMEFIAQEQQRVLNKLELLSLFQMLSATSDLMNLTFGVMEKFVSLKRKRGLYDFTDLIDHTRDLLVRSSSAAWILYKLDGGIDHILVDEAQDTSPAQWEIIQALANEFFSGEGARFDAKRTVFVVGDRKQSIFSFQGSDPAAFDDSRQYFRKKIEASDRKFNMIDLFESYRSVPTVLKAVDEVFVSEIARAGLEETSEISIRHYASRRDEPGVVEVWPLLQHERIEENAPLDPVDSIPRNHPRRQLAARVADRIKEWVGRRTIRASNRTVRPDDILILVRTRNAFFDAMIAELNERGIPVAGADRLKLGEHIAVKDLLSLAKFALLPDDDLSLAEVLKSPLAPESFDEERLAAIAVNRGNQSLWQCLKASGDSLNVTFLEQVTQYAIQSLPFEFFSSVLLKGDPSGRKRIYRRLGPASADAIDAFLDRCLAAELDETPSLQGFVSRFESEEIEIKRDMQHNEGEVRIMTVHGAKGLEANIVIVPDAADLPNINRDMSLLMVDRGREEPPIPFWRLTSHVEPVIVREWKNQTRRRLLEEYRRNLYVALTRACDELYIGGVVTKGELKDESWYALAHAALSRIGETLEDGTLVYRSGNESFLDSKQENIKPRERSILPEWARQKPEKGLGERPYVRPSDPAFVDSKTGLSPLDHKEVRRFQRGTLIHKLVQILPDIDEGDRARAAEAFLRRHGLAEPDQYLIRDEVLKLFQAMELQPYFAPGSLAEVPIASLLGDAETHVSGRIDRLAVTETDVHLVDFKTDRHPPAKVENVSADYINQLSLYVRSLQLIYPNHKVNAALLWTVEPRLMLIPAHMLH